MSERVTVFLGLGSNLDGPEQQVRSAIDRLVHLPDTGVVACSSLWRTAPVGYDDQPPFINAVCELRTGLKPDALLKETQAIEQAAGRDRSGPRFGPRTLDIDILIYGALSIDSAALAVPHPRMRERAFVLYPLAEIARERDLPGLGRVEQWLPTVAGQGVERLPGGPVAPGQVQVAG